MEKAHKILLQNSLKNPTMNRYSKFLILAIFFIASRQASARHSCGPTTRLSSLARIQNHRDFLEEEETRALLREIMGLESVGLSMSLSLSLPMLSLSLPMLSLSLPMFSLSLPGPYEGIKTTPNIGVTPTAAPTAGTATPTPEKVSVQSSVNSNHTTGTQEPSSTTPTMSPAPQHQAGGSAPKASGSVGASSRAGVSPAAIAGFVILAVAAVVAAGFFVFYRRTRRAAASSSGSISSGPDDNSSGSSSSPEAV